MSDKPEMEVRVDAGKCLAYGTCVGLAPDHFDLPARAKIVVVVKRTVADDEREDVEEAVRNCPARALSLHQAES
jgi:ferredoxin